MQHSRPTSAFLFDLDGVLISSVDLHYEAFRRTFLPEGVELDFETYCRVGIGASRENVIRAIVPDIDVAKLNHLMAEKERHVRDYLQDNGLRPIDGSIDLLDRVQARRLPMAVATASRTPLLFLEAIDALDYFTAVIDRNMVERPKPEPDIYLLAAKSLHVEPAACVVVEDSPVGIAAARAAGMRVIAVTTTHERAELSDATAIVDTFEAIDVDDWTG